jgi:hypothetical protein
MANIDRSNTTSAMDLDASVSSLELTSSQKSLGRAELIQHVSKIVKNQERAGLIILELINKYSFDFQDFKQLLRGMLITLEFLK